MAKTKQGDSGQVVIYRTPDGKTSQGRGLVDVIARYPLVVIPAQAGIQ